MAKTLISPAELSKIHKLSYQTINYYTNLGLLTVKKRNANSRFYNSREVCACLKKIAELKNKGYSLKLIRDLLMEG